MTPAAARADMVACAIAPYPQLQLSRIEIDAPCVSYTYLTLTKLTEAYPDTDFYFIMGADSLDYFEQWVHPEIICEKAALLVAVRDERDLAEITQKTSAIQALFSARIYPVRGGRTAVSSTVLRRQLREAQECPAQLPGPVWRYIREHGLYM